MGDGGGFERAVDGGDEGVFEVGELGEEAGLDFLLNEGCHGGT